LPPPNTTKYILKLIKHTSYNLLGLGLPLIVAVFSIPALINSLGTDKFGILTLIWAVVSYFGLFDLGLGRALTQQLAVLLDKGDHKQVGPTVMTATILMAALGVFAGLLMVVFAPWGVSLIQAVPNKQEVIHAVFAMALAMPAIVLTSGFRGILEAQHAFGIINAIRVPMGLFTFLGPLLAISAGHPGLDSITIVLCIGRLFACVIHAWFAWKCLPPDHGGLRFQNERLKPLLVSGGWLTVSNIVSPFMGYIDRFLIGAIISATAVTYYATPLELVTKLWIIPGALTTVLFPTFAVQMTERNDGTRELFTKSVHWLLVALIPITSALALFAHDILSIWINPAFAKESTFLLQLFSFGILINCLAHIPFTLIQSAGSPKVTALIHLFELPFFLATLWLLATKFGVIGAAFAWFIRMALDTIAMFIYSTPLIGMTKMNLFNKKSISYALLTLICFLGITFESHLHKWLWLITFSVIFVATLKRKNQYQPAIN
jgi:O-antigen/teichoic acid export membrane protein